MLASSMTVLSTIYQDPTGIVDLSLLAKKAAMGDMKIEKCDLACT